MQINPIKLMNKTKFNNDYRNEDKAVLDYFDYAPFTQFSDRIDDMENKVNRNQLVNILKKINESWDAPKETFKQIERLQDEKSVVVIGGQQAGLVTGPLYTVNKIISIIQLARKQEKALNVPVVPVFWIAGEDHDYDEINHTYIQSNGTIKKLITNQRVHLKQSVSHISIDRQKTKDWLQQLFLSLQETEHTKELYESLYSILEKSESFVDFFARTIFHLFKNEGIVLFDSADKSVRVLEHDFFIQLIEQQQPFAEAVAKQVEQLRNDGHTVTINAELDDGHLFYHDERNERILLKRAGSHWVGKNEEIKLTTDELIEVAKRHPERLSNNVVSRPLMQEYLFPTLAFVAGDGEISYWAALKKAFHTFDFKMPPVVPRLSFTYINKKMASILNERFISAESVLNQGIKRRKINWLQSQHYPPIDVLIDEVKQEIEKVHLPVQEAAKTISDDIYQLAKRNLEIIEREVDYMYRRMNDEVKKKFQAELEKFDYIDHMLQPNGVLQERIWNPLLFINENGYDFLRTLITSDIPFENEHYLVYL